MSKFKIFPATEFSGISVPVIIIQNMMGFIAWVQYKDAFGREPRISGVRYYPSDLTPVEREQINRSVNALLTAGLVKSRVNWVGVDPPIHYSELDFRNFLDISQEEFQNRILSLEPVTSDELKNMLSNGLIELMRATSKIEKAEKTANSELEKMRRQQQATLKAVIYRLIEEDRLADAIAYCQTFGKDINHYLKGDGRFDLIITPSNPNT